MFSLKTLWSGQTREAAKIASSSVGPLTSIPRSVTPFPRSEIRDEPLADNAASIETRGADRFVPNRTSTVLVAETGKKIGARIINVSALGVAVEADFSQVPAQSIVMVGERKVKPGRKIARGTVFLFETRLPPHLCGPHFII